MSASNYNWVCFRCRSAVRQPKTSPTTPKCAECGSDLFCLGYTVEVPRKLDVRGWRKLHLDCRQRTLDGVEQQAVRRVRQVHAAERELARLRALGPAKGRQKLIREMERRAQA